MNKDEKVIRVRFAPSPTGPLHIGGVRTALYNFLFARKNNGKFILRIEDTDQNRYVPGAEKYIQEALSWCSLDLDEGPNVGGEFGPYRQSERKEMYYSFVKNLIDSGDAYYAFDTPEELDGMRESMRSAGVPSPTYNNISRSSMINSLTLPLDETEKRISRGDKFVVRIKMPRNHEIKFKDKIRGWVSVNSNNIDDKVIYKSDGMPTYHLANVVDDYSMKISHVIRGEEWLPSAPLHVYLYKCLGWEDQTPQFAHLPLILKPDGNGKLSKRDGDRLGFPVFPVNWKNPETNEIYKGYREEGFSRAAFINMLAFLGWNPGTEKEVFNLDELVSEFSLSRVGKSGAKYDFNKLKWFNQQHLRRMDNEEIYDNLVDKKVDFSINPSKEYWLKVIGLVKERATFLDDLKLELSCFLSNKFTYDVNSINKKWNLELLPHLSSLATIIFNLQKFTSSQIEISFHNYLDDNDLSLGQLMPMLRIAITGRLAGPSMFGILELLGKEEVKLRIDRAIKDIQHG
tara:strand:- start:2075 stop:3616 length:1542 start_codon:yes stop_codon:yes gene_type:complete